MDVDTPLKCKKNWVWECLKSCEVILPLFCLAEMTKRDLIGYCWNHHPQSRAASYVISFLLRSYQGSAYFSHMHSAQLLPTQAHTHAHSGLKDCDGAWLVARPQYCGVGEWRPCQADFTMMVSELGWSYQFQHADVKTSPHLQLTLSAG